MVFPDKELNVSAEETVLPTQCEAIHKYMYVSYYTAVESIPCMTSQNDLI